jgi:hypothetical protein
MVWIETLEMYFSFDSGGLCRNSISPPIASFSRNQTSRQIPALPPKKNPQIRRLSRNPKDKGKKRKTPDREKKEEIAKKVTHRRKRTQKKQKMK